MYIIVQNIDIYRKPKTPRKEGEETEKAKEERRKKEEKN
jgi:hypothetical protein